jgi:hypothetical protein
MKDGEPDWDEATFMLREIYDFNDAPPILKAIYAAGRKDMQEECIAACEGMSPNAKSHQAEAIREIKP